MNKRFLQLIAFVLLLTSCTDKKDGERHLQASIGQMSEVVLILPTNLTRGELADSLTAMLTCNVPGLNQGEDFFRLSRIPVTMDKGETKKMHSRVIVKIDPTQQKAGMGTAKDVYVKPQLEVLLTAPTEEALLTYVSEHKEKICETLLEAQLKNQTRHLRQHASQRVMKDLKAHLGYTIYAPEEIMFTKKGKNFLWGSNRAGEKQLNMVFYRVPYNGQDMSDVKVLCQLRDSVMQANIPGSEPDQWMETTWENDEPMVMLTKKTIDGEPVSEIRGLWQMRHGAMGGPFVAHFRLDKDKGELIVSEGFVFSPSTTKRDLVRRLESALQTFSAHNN